MMRDKCLSCRRVLRGVYHHSHLKRVHLLWLPALLLAVLLVFGVRSSASAAGDSQSQAAATAQRLISKISDKVGGASVGTPQLVYNPDGRTPAYYVVPIVRGGDVVGLIGVSPDGGKWQWYTTNYAPTGFPQTSRSRAAAMLGTSAASLKLVAGRDNRLYWQSPDGRALDVDRPSRQGTSVTLQAQGAGATYDARPGKYSELEVQKAKRRATLSPQSTEADTGSGTLPTRYNLDVPHYYQKTDYYCGPASLEMIFDLYGPDISQYDIADAMPAKNWGSWSGAYSDDLVRAARFSYISKAVLDPNLQGYKQRRLGYAAIQYFWSYYGTSDPDYPNRYRDLKRLIVAGYPVVVLTWYDSRHITGHFRVVKGYDDSTDEFIVHDPWYTAPYYGPDVHFNQEFFVDNLWTKFKRWAALITPWQVSVSAPRTVQGGSTFKVTATITYPAITPLTGWAQVSNSVATILLPSGFTTDDVTQGLPQVTYSGTSQTVTWTVTAPEDFEGQANIRVTAKGLISSSSTSYSSYSDWIGGMGSDTIYVNQPPASVSVSPSSLRSGPNQYQTIQATYSDPGGAGTISRAMIRVSDPDNPSNDLLAAYDTATGKIYLLSSDGSSTLSTASVGSSYTLQSSYGSVDPSKTTVSTSGNQMVITWAVSRPTSASGSTNVVYLQAKDKYGASSGWQKEGSWVLNSPATADAVADAGAVVSPGRTVQIRATYSDPDGASNIRTAQLLINTQLTGNGSVWVRYDTAQNAMYIRSGDNTYWAGPVTPGSSQSQSNGRATLLGASSAVSRSGNTLSITWGLKFDQSFSGRQYSIYSVAADNYTPDSALPWLKFGTYTVDAPPAVGNVTPGSGISSPGNTVYYTASYSDPDGASNIADARLLIGTSTSDTRAVQLRYDANGNRLYLKDDNSSAWLGGVSPGSSSSVSNGLATLFPNLTTVSRSGNTLTIKWAISYGTALSGRQYNTYLMVRDDFARAKSWQREGTWIVDRSPYVGTTSPRNSGTSSRSWVVFKTTWYDPDGASNIRRVTFYINSSPSGYKGLMAKYEANSNKLWLKSADNSTWLGGVAPGAPDRIRNGYVSIDPPRIKVSSSGTQMTITWYVFFTRQIAGRNMNIYMSIVDDFGRAQSPVKIGTWYVR